jgi:hypothetical protein
LDGNEEGLVEELGMLDGVRDSDGLPLGRSLREGAKEGRILSEGREDGATDILGALLGSNEGPELGSVLGE